MLTQEQRQKLLDAGYSEQKVRAYEAVKQSAQPTNGAGNDIKEAFRGSLGYAKQGYEEAKTAKTPLGKLDAGLKEGVGVLGAALSPLAPATKYIGKAIQGVADVVSESPSVQKFATSPAGDATMKGAEFVANTAALAGLRGTPKVIPKGSAIKTPPRATMGEVPPTGGVGSYARSAARDIIPTKQGFINEEVAKALDLTPGDLSNIAKSSGNEIGPWLSEHNLIGQNKIETQTNVNRFYKQNYVTVREEIGKVTKTYKQAEIPRYVDSLKQLQKQVTGVPGLEKDAVAVENLLNKADVTLADVQMAKELLDDYFTLYKVTGDVSQNVTKQGLANVRGELKTFIEKEVKQETGADIQKMNNNVSTARSLEDAIITRSPVGLKRSNIRVGDLGIFGVGWAFGGPLVGAGLLFGKKLLESPTVRLRLARVVDKWSDAQKQKAAAELESGIIPEEFAPFVKQKEMVGVTPPKGPTKASPVKSNP